MAKKLVVVESPAKAKTINKILGADYIVKSSMGHVRDLPIKTLGVDVEDSFKPTYVDVKGRKDIIDDLKKTAKQCDAIYLAPDPDREGEAIAWHLKELLCRANKKAEFLRVQYNEVTPTAVRKAFEAPGVLNMNRVDAQQARRILDRLVGYTVSPMLWRRIRRGLSAGRVQSVALRIVCEREIEIKKFVPEKFWIFGAMVRKLVTPLDPFRVKLTRIDDEKAEIKSTEHAGKITTDLEGRKMRVEKVSIKEVTKRPAPPYITSTLQQAGSSHCGFSPKRTMSIAQRLYEGIDHGDGPVGLITYMRTDSFSIAADALNSCRELITNNFGKEYCPEKPNFYKSRSSAQEAHEAIRPTDVTKTPESLANQLESADMKVYKLIWTRFVASQMAPAKIGQRTARIEAIPTEESPTHYLFQATHSQINFHGYMKAGVREDAKKADDDENTPMPDLKEGEQLECLEILADEKETQPPPHFSEASLVRSLEQNGIGRPSTYAQIISTLTYRKYVTSEKRTLRPTDLGMEVSELLVSDLGDLFNVTFTAKMEQSLDDIENGKIEWTAMLQDFYGQFSEWMKKAKAPSADAKVTQQVLDALKHVTQWAPEVKRGKRTYSDEKFIQSITKQIEKGEKPVSQRQLIALLKIACRYREDTPELGKMLTDTGNEEMLSLPELQPPKETTLKKFGLLKELTMEDATRKFVDSLNSRVESGRCLTDAQLQALNNVVLSHSKHIPDFDQIKESLELANSAVEDDNESGPLIGAMKDVKEWKEPVTRGKRVFDDKAFYESLSQHFQTKGFLSVKQRAALKRLVRRYREQVAGYEQIAEEFGLSKKQ